jgi:methionine biosynthesis protein MetW
MTAADGIRLDHRVIFDIVEPGAKVLDLGCGDGDLLALLVREKQVRAQGIELSEEAIYRCVQKGMSVFHGDLDSGLDEYPDQSFDYIILNQSLQEVKKVHFLIDEALRVGRKVIVGFPNFGHWRVRWALALRGRTPVTEALPHYWYDSPNLHFLTIEDFRDFCRDRRIEVLKSVYLGEKKPLAWVPNLLASNAIFVLAGRS